MIKKLIKLATHLDKKGRYKEAEYLDTLIRRAGADPDEEASGVLNEDPEAGEKKSSKWQRMKMSRVVEEMGKNDFNSLSFEINDYTIRVTKKRDEDNG
jgi:hypothetical protein